MKYCKNISSATVSSASQWLNDRVKIDKNWCERLLSVQPLGTYHMYRVKPDLRPIRQVAHYRLSIA